MRYFFWIVLLAIELSSCASTLEYPTTAPLEAKKFTTKTGFFQGNIPRGWFSSQDTLVDISLEAWLLRDDLSAAIIFREINLDGLSKELIADEGLEYLTTISVSSHTNDSLRLLKPPSEFSLGKQQYCSAEIGSNSITKRVVVFESGNRYIECEVRPVTGIWNQQSLNELFTVQQSVLASLQFSAQLP